MSDEVQVRVDATPNPDAMKFTLNKKVAEQPTTIADAQAADTNPVAKALFALKGVKSLFLLNDFITLSKDASAEWGAIVPEAERILKEHYKS